MRSTPADIVIFPHSRFVGTARWLLDLAETRSDEAMSFIWEGLLDDLEARMIECGFGIEERAHQLNGLYALVQTEGPRRWYEGRVGEPDEAA